MRVHGLKTHPAPFAALADGSKTFEFRKDDRNFQVGDVLRLDEWNPEVMENEVCVGAYTGHSLSFIVSYKLAGRFGVPEGYCVLELKLPTVQQLEAKLREVEEERDDAVRRAEDLQDLVDAYENQESEEATIDIFTVARMPSLDRDQMLAGLKREVLAVGGTWP